MCVDDYQFRHYSAVRPKQCRRFQILNQQDLARNYYVNISQFEQHGEVGLCKILIYLSSKGLSIDHKKFYLPKFQAIIEPFSLCRVAFESLDDKDVLLRVYDSSKSNQEIFGENIDWQQPTRTNTDQKQDWDIAPMEQQQQLQAVLQYLEYSPMETHEPISEMVDQSEQKNQSQQDKMSSNNNKKLKQPERGIAQVITAVKQWRSLYQSKSCSLTKAAGLVGISKKSLDDYYLVLRVAEVLGFDFKNNLQQKMGELRNFIKAQNQQHKVKGKMGKKVACFDLVGPVDVKMLMAGESSHQ